VRHGLETGLDKKMIQPSPITFILLSLGVLTFLILIFLPFILELKKPKNAGPRLILDDIPILKQLQMVLKVPIVNMEEEFRANHKTISTIAFLTDLEDCTFRIHNQKSQGNQNQKKFIA